MRKALWAFNEERTAQGQPPIEVGLGICNGEAVSGNIASADRMDYTVIGDAVNVASRMEGLTKVFPCKVLFNDGIYEAVKDRFPCVYLGEEYVQGREAPVHVYGISDDWIRYHSHSYHIQEPAPEEL
ncbi:MAG: adenylate/guanylate cyclase domain-containing protein [Chloroflexi bacterium]|nr:adenylate/guanylate cyclase domain-containing protein [Chloroflexota bacterium]